MAIFVISYNDRILVYGQDTSILGRDCMSSECDDMFDVDVLVVFEEFEVVFKFEDMVL